MLALTGERPTAPKRCRRGKPRLRAETRAFAEMKHAGMLARLIVYFGGHYGVQARLRAETLFACRIVRMPRA
ncbi:MAG: hypothetical protein ACXWMC_10930 [Syntrophales bacterium]